VSALMTAPEAADETALAAREATPVIEVIAGWPDRGGGISQFMRYLLEENAREARLAVRAVLDPRGRGGAVATLWNLPLALARLVWLRLRGESGAVLHLHMAGRLSTLRKLSLLLAGKALGFVCVLHHHEYGYAAYLRSLPAPLRALAIAALRLADHQIVLGAGERERLPALLKLPAERFSVVLNGVPRRALQQARQPEPGRVLFVGGLSERKGVSDLLQACKQLGPGVRLAICGGGPIERYQALARELGVLDRCEFLGQCPPETVQRELARASVFTLPSYAEGLSVALLEAMAAGCPVVATMVGEHREVLEPGTNALVTPPGDIERLAAALQALLSDQALAARLGAAGRETIAARFTAERALRQVEAALRTARGPAT